MTTTTKSVHTPGQRTVAHAGFDRTVCVVARRAGRPVTVATFNSGNKDEDEANARLDVAAPDLLALATLGRAAIGCHNAPGDCYSTGPLTGNVINDLIACPACAYIEAHRAAIAKATGAL